MHPEPGVLSDGCFLRDVALLRILRHICSLEPSPALVLSLVRVYEDHLSPLPFLERLCAHDRTCHVGEDVNQRVSAGVCGTPGHGPTTVPLMPCQVYGAVYGAVLCMGVGVCYLCVCVCVSVYVLCVCVCLCMCCVCVCVGVLRMVERLRVAARTTQVINCERPRRLARRGRYTHTKGQQPENKPSQPPSVTMRSKHSRGSSQL
jgi:hypothetical protein